MTDFFGEFAAARFSGDQHREPLGLKPSMGHADLSRFSDAVGAFKCDENAFLAHASDGTKKKEAVRL
jgi:hypothetical protein